MRTCRVGLTKRSPILGDTISSRTGGGFSATKGSVPSSSSLLLIAPSESKSYRPSKELKGSKAPPLFISVRSSIPSRSRSKGLAISSCRIWWNPCFQSIRLPHPTIRKPHPLPGEYEAFVQNPSDPMSWTKHSKNPSRLGY